MRRGSLRSIFILLILLIGITGTVSARDILQGEACLVEANQVIGGNVFVICRTLTIDGQVNGQLIGVAYEATINGSVDGNVYLGGGQLDLSGDVNGSLHFIGVILNIASTENDSDSQESRPLVDGNLVQATLTTTIDESSQIRGGILGLGYQLRIHGTVQQDIDYWGSAVTIDGTIQADIDVSVGDPASDSDQIKTLLLPLGFDINLDAPGLTVTDHAQIEGRLIYAGPVEGDIQGNIDGSVTFQPSTQATVPTFEEPETIRVYLEQVLRDFSTLAVIAGIGLLLIPQLIQAPLPVLRTRSVSSFSIGMLSFLLSFPIVLIGLLIGLLIVFVLAILGLDGVLVIALVALGLINVGGATIFYFVAIFVSRVITGLAIGKLLNRMFNGNGAHGGIVTYAFLFAGLLVLVIFSSLPTIGWIVNAIALFLGLGSILVVILEYLQTVRDRQNNGLTWQNANVQPTPSANEASVWQTQSPMTITPELPPGMDNLPPGFHPDFFEDSE